MNSLASVSPHSENRTLELISSQLKNTKELQNISERISVMEEDISYQGTRLQDSFLDLSKVGEYLLTAYAGSKGSVVNSNVAELMLGCQKLFNCSIRSTNLIANTCSNALKKHNFALNFLEQKKDYNAALERVKECGEFAKKMAKFSEELFNQSSELYCKSEVAFMESVKQESKRTEDLDKLEECIKNFKVELATKKQLVSDLHKQIKEYREEELKTTQSEEKMRNRALMLKTAAGFAGLMTPLAHAGLATIVPQGTLTQTSPLEDLALKVTANWDHGKVVKNLNVIDLELAEKQKLLEQEKDNPSNAKQLEIEIAKLQVKRKQTVRELEDTTNQKGEFQKIGDTMDQQADRMEQKKEQIANLRRKLQTKELELTANLTELGEKLKGCDQKEKKNNRAIIALELTVKTLGRITTICDRAKRFWQEVGDRSESLTDTQNLAIASELGQDCFKESLIDNLIRWAILGTVNQEANNLIKQADESLTRVLGNLPTREEAKRLLQPRISLDALASASEKD